MREFLAEAMCKNKEKLVWSDKNKLILNYLSIGPPDLQQLFDSSGSSIAPFRLRKGMSTENLLPNLRLFLVSICHQVKESKALSPVEAIHILP